LLFYTNLFHASNYYKHKGLEGTMWILNNAAKETSESVSLRRYIYMRIFILDIHTDMLYRYYHFTMLNT